MNIHERWKSRFDWCWHLGEIAAELDKLDLPEPDDVGAAHVCWGGTMGDDTESPYAYLTLAGPKERGGEPETIHLCVKSEERWSIYCTLGALRGELEEFARRLRAEAKRRAEAEG